MQQLTTYLQCLILDNNNIIDMIDNFISEFSITNSWNAEKWSRLMEDVKNMTDGDSRKRSMRKLRAIVFAANKFIVNKGNYVTHQGLVNMPIFQSYDKIYKQPITVNHIRRIEAETIFGVLNMDCIDAGKMLQEEGYHPAVLNMACEDGPGGGVIGGCYGQEESLFRRSNLYVYLYPYSPHALECNLQSKHPQYPLNGNFDGIYGRGAFVTRFDSFGSKFRLVRYPTYASPVFTAAIGAIVRKYACWRSYFYVRKLVGSHVCAQVHGTGIGYFVQRASWRCQLALLGVFYQYRSADWIFNAASAYLVFCLQYLVFCAFCVCFGCGVAFCQCGKLGRELFLKHARIRCQVVELFAVCCLRFDKAACARHFVFIVSDLFPGGGYL